MRFMLEDAAGTPMKILFGAPSCVPATGFETAGAALDGAALAAHCRERISPQKTPAHWIEVSEWPMTGSGKIQKFVLRDRFVNGEFVNRS